MGPEDNRQALLLLAQQPGNDICADCKNRGVEYASVTFGVFLCSSCASQHRSLGAHISKVKSLTLDNWSEDLVEMMKSLGNIEVNSKYEAIVPAFYRRPEPADPWVVSEQWVRAKYEREEFMSGNEEKQAAYVGGEKSGWLLKRGRDSQEYLRRKFIMSQNSDTLKYYIKERDSKPKASLKLSELNVAFCPGKIGNQNGLQITYEVGDTRVTRCLFVYAESGRDIVEWYNAIRGCKYHLKQSAFPSDTQEQILAGLTHDFEHEGWLYKSGPKATDAYRRRWFTLENRKLMYFGNPMDPIPKGEVLLGHSTDRYSIIEGLPPGEKQIPGFGFTLKTPSRSYSLTADTADDRTSWIHSIHRVLERPLTPQERSWFRYKKA